MDSTIDMCPDCFRNQRSSEKFPWGYARAELCRLDGRLEYVISV